MVEESGPLETAGWDKSWEHQYRLTVFHGKVKGIVIHLMGYIHWQSNVAGWEIHFKLEVYCWANHLKKKVIVLPMLNK